MWGWWSRRCVEGSSSSDDRHSSRRSVIVIKYLNVRVIWFFPPGTFTRRLGRRLRRRGGRERGGWHHDWHCSWYGRRSGYRIGGIAVGYKDKAGVCFHLSVVVVRTRAEWRRRVLLKRVDTDWSWNRSIGGRCRRRGSFGGGRWTNLKGSHMFPLLHGNGFTFALALSCMYFF